jgi:hypothetical protein
MAKIKYALLPDTTILNNNTKAKHCNYFPLNGMAPDKEGWQSGAEIAILPADWPS